MPQAHEWPKQIQVIGAGTPEQSRDMAFRFIQALSNAGYAQEDVDVLWRGIAERTYRAMFLSFEDGSDMWLIEKMGVWPPQNWRLTNFLSRMHNPPCGTCGHQSEDTMPHCHCGCHELFNVILNYEE